VGLLAPPFDSARSSIQPEILEGPQYVVGNALINVILQAGQVAGFVAGGALVAALSTRGALAMDAATFLLSAGCVLSLVKHRPAAQAREERSSLLVDTGKGIRLVRESPDLLRYLGISVLASVAVIAPEGLAVPAATELGRGAVAAGILTATIPVGFVVGSPLLLRLTLSRRLELLIPLCVLCMLPLVASPLAPNVAALVLIWTVSGLGASLNLVASAAFVQACPPAYRGRAYGVAVTTLYGTQGIVLLASGAHADQLGARGAVATIAGAALVILFSLPALRNSAPQENAQSVR
jgi:predicted MFS family arabinose efflux permease